MSALKKFQTLFVTHSIGRRLISTTAAKLQSIELKVDKVSKTSCEFNQ